MEVLKMRSEYDIKSLNPRENPYIKKTKKQVTMNLDSEIVEYFKKQGARKGIPYQTLINLCLLDIINENKEFKTIWI